MKSRTLAVAGSFSLLALFTACSTNAPRVDSSPSRSSTAANERQYGNVSSIDVVAASSRGAGGAVLGAVIGAVIGNQVGSGSGRAAATGLGAVGGAVIGSNIDKRNDSDVYRVSVRMDNGSTGRFDYANIDDLRVGDRVRVQGGQLHRI